MTKEYVMECSVWSIAYRREAVDDENRKISWCLIMENFSASKAEKSALLCWQWRAMKIENRHDLRWISGRLN